jgi:hypothetical protein
MTIDYTIKAIPTDLAYRLRRASRRVAALEAALERARREVGAR